MNSPRSNQMLFGDMPFELDVLNYLENDLDAREKVSLVFLLYEDIHVANQKLFVMFQTHKELSGSSPIENNLLHEWARSEGDHWKEKLVEALLIIKAYSNVKKLRLNLEAMKSHFHTNLRQVSLFVNPVKKVLYNICETLVLEEVKRIVNNIREKVDLELYEESVYFQHFELYIMQLIVSGLVKIPKWNHNGIDGELVDVNFLIDFLNKSDFKSCGNDLKYSQDRINLQISELSLGLTKSVVHKSEPRFMKSDDKYSEGHKYVVNTAPENINKESIYIINDPCSVGWIYIINQMKFENKQNPDRAKGFDERIGSAADVERLKKTWKSFGFEPYVDENLKSAEFMNNLGQFLTSLIEERHSVFVLCILSHGRKDSIISSDCIELPIEDIENMFDASKAPQLAGKPKILLIQACQGSTKQLVVTPSTVKIEKHRIVMDGPTHVPQKSDMLKFYSTVPNYESFRDTVEGSWFIQTLCDVMDKVKPNESKDILDICTSVTRDVSFRRYENFAQTPEARTTLTKRLYLKKNRKTANIKL